MNNLYLIYPLANSMPETFNDLQTALNEAKRLSRMNRHMEFFVLSAIASVKVKPEPVDVEEIKPETLIK